MADLNDKLIKQSSGTQPLPTTLSAQKNSGASTASLNAATGWDTTTAKHIRMYKTKVVNGITVPDWDFVCFYKGTLSGTTLSNLTLVWSSTGSDQTFGIGDTVDLSYTSGWGEDLYSALSTHLDQDGTLKADAVDETAVIKDAVITRPKLASGFAGEFTSGWLTGDLPAVSTVTANGNRSYTLGFASTVASTLSEGMRLRTTRTVASTQNAFSLDGSNDYYNKTSPSGLTFTTTFTCSAWVYATAYQQGGIIARRNADTEGWSFVFEADGRISLTGLRIASNNKGIASYQSIPLNKWVHVAATLDMAAGDTSAQKIWIDGTEVPRSYSLVGTATALVQGTTALVVGSRVSAGGSYFPGYIDQAAVFSSQLSDATIKAMISQGLTGSESGLVSGYANGSTTDLNTTNANNLTAQNGATTVASAPWGNRGLSTTLDYALVMNVSGSNVTVQVPEGCTIPTTGGITSVAYSTQANPYGWVGDKGRWAVTLNVLADVNASGTSTATAYNPGGLNIHVPIGYWAISASLQPRINSTAGPDMFAGISTSSSALQTGLYKRAVGNSSTGGTFTLPMQINKSVSNSSATPYYLIIYAGAAVSLLQFRSDTTTVEALPSGL